MPSTNQITSLLSLLAIGASAVDLLEKYNFPNNELGATAFALLYGKPLLYYSQEFSGAIGLSQMGTNGYYVTNDGYLSNSSVTEVVRPNVDTLYSISVLDFSESDVEVYLPPYDKDRVVMMDFWDPYGSCFGELGSIPQNSPGTYLLRPNIQGITTAPDSCDAKYQGCIDSPTGDATMLVRIGVSNNGTDETRAREYINTLTVNTTNKHEPLFDTLQPSDFTFLSSDEPKSIMQLLSRLADRNPPQTADYAEEVPKILKMAGISNGTYVQPLSVSLTDAYGLMNSSISEYKESPESITMQNNGWYIINPATQGAFKNSTDLQGRNWWGLSLYLTNLPVETIYPQLEINSFNLTADECYLLTFQSKPLISNPGLWSVTAYDESGHLIANSQNVYEVGDRSNITYPDGTMVYPLDGKNTSHPDGPFQILIQQDGVAPPANWTHNWLPTPNDNNNFTLTFRLYNPMDDMKNKQYQYPTIEKVAAVTAN